MRGLRGDLSTAGAEFRALWEGLAVAGQTGTLEDELRGSRLESPIAHGKVRRPGLSLSSRLAPGFRRSGSGGSEPRMYESNTRDQSLVVMGRERGVGAA
jgi:hypothetical protein